MHCNTYQQTKTYCQVKHSLPGRLRVSSQGLKYLTEYNPVIQENIEKISGIKKIQINNLTENILLYFDPKKQTEQNILGFLERIFSDFSLIIYQEERKQKNKNDIEERKLHEEPVSDMLKNVALIGTVLLTSLIKRKLSGSIIRPTLLGRLTTPVSLATLFFSKSVFKSGIKSLQKTKKPNADTLSALAVTTSLISGQDLSALTVMFLHETAELLTGYTMNRTRKAISGMLSVGEDYVWRENNGKNEKVAISDIQLNDVILVHTGEKISVDGVVIRGEGVIDESSITGEFFPVNKKVKDQVYAGTISKSGTLAIQAKKIGDDTAVARIITMVEEANQHKAPIQAYADRFSSQIIPLNFLLAGVVYLATRNITRALNMLIIDYSCGIRLSTAAALSASINTAAKNGILIKGSNYIELLSEADTLILDKTGTLTQGQPQVTSVVTHEDITEKELIALAASAEETSSHPLALAILEKANCNQIDIPAHEEISIIVAKGVQTKINGNIIRVGSQRFMKENSIETQFLKERINTLKGNGESIVYVAKDKLLLGVLGIQDPLRSNMKKALNRLRSYGVDDMLLLTGDLESQAKIVADRMTMDRFESELLPEEKAKIIMQLQSNGSKVVMVGDGINDGPALAYSDVGIAIGNTKTDIAMEAADITITSDNPMMIPAAYNLSKKTMKIVRQNFATAIGINTVGLVLGALGVLPVFWGAVLHNSSTILVVGNSLRLLFEDLDKRG